LFLQPASPLPPPPILCAFELSVDRLITPPFFFPFDRDETRAPRFFFPRIPFSDSLLWIATAFLRRSLDSFALQTSLDRRQPLSPPPLGSVSLSLVFRQLASIEPMASRESQVWLPSHSALILNAMKRQPPPNRSHFKYPFRCPLRCFRSHF